MRRCLLVLVIGAVGVVPFAGLGNAIAQPTPHFLKACSAYAEDHFGDVTAHLPDGTKCIGSGEYCSHGPGFARVYREYGYVCESNGRLEER
jgi:hypothetical protein